MMKSPTVLAALAATCLFALVYVPAADAKWSLTTDKKMMYYEGCTISGRAKTSKRDVSLEDCMDNCISNAKCTHYSWAESDDGDDDGTCSLFQKSSNDGAYMVGDDLDRECGFKYNKFGEPADPVLPPQGSRPSNFRPIDNFYVPGNRFTQFDDWWSYRWSYPHGEDAEEVGELPDELSSSEKKKLLSSINRMRKAEGLSVVAVSEDLVDAAMYQAEFLANECVMTHMGDSGSTPEQRVEQAGFNADNVWEIVSVGQRSVRDFTGSWWGLTKHYENMLKADATHVGFARVLNDGCDGYETYWTLVFASEG